MAAPADRRYLDSHEWHKLDNDGNVVIGISQFAVDELTDITFLEIEATEGEISKGEAFGEIESVKATSEMYSGIDGEVVEVNQAVLDDPSIINEDPYDKGWMLKIKPSDPSQLDDLLEAEDYEKKHGG
jgi:glycine cleavage system H protein